MCVIAIFDSGNISVCWHQIRNAGYTTMLLLVVIGVVSCSKSGDSEVGEFDTASQMDSDSITTSNADADTDSNSDAETDSDFILNSNTDFATDEDTATESVIETPSDVGTNQDTETTTAHDTVEDTNSENPIDTESHFEPDSSQCLSGQHSECYGDGVWCYDDDSPVTRQSICDFDRGEECVELSSVKAQCMCLPTQYKKCYGGDVWSYNSCDEIERMEEDCTGDMLCLELDTDDVHCMQCEQYWTGPNCDECGGHGNGIDCQCPAPDFVPSVYSAACWTCPLGMVVDLNTRECIGISTDYSAEDALSICPDGTHFPSSREIVDYLIGTHSVKSTEIDGNIYYSSSLPYEQTGAAVNLWRSEGIEAVWTSDICAIEGESGYWVIDIEAGGGFCETSSTAEHQVMCIFNEVFGE